MESLSIMDTRLCTACGRCLHISSFHARATQCKQCRKLVSADYYVQNKARINSQTTQKNNEIRAAVLNLLGSSCAACGETEPDFLSVDHVHNDRKLERSRNSITWKTDIVRGVSDPSRYQVLCRNCNEAKQRCNPSQILKVRTPTGTLKKCSSCLLKHDISQFSTSSYRGKRCFDSTCASCTRFYILTITIQCYVMLGGACLCCGMDEPWKLNVDHVDGSGGLRRSLGEKTGAWLCRKILNGDVESKSFQLLCANCNYSKMRHGSCVHSKCVRPELGHVVAEWAKVS